MKEKAFSGKATAKGFVIRGKKSTVSSKDYRKKKLGFLRVGRAFICGLSIYFFVTLVIGPVIKSLAVSTRDLCSLCYLLVAIAIPIGFVAQSRKSKQWHACEHKVMRLINKDLDLTLENLKRMNRLSFNCGTELFSSISLAAFVLCLSLRLTEIDIALSPMLLLSWAVGLFMLPVPLPTQYLVTERPTKEQLQEALRVAKEFKQEF